MLLRENGAGASFLSRSVVVLKSLFVWVAIVLNRQEHFSGWQVRISLGEETNSQGQGKGTLSVCLTLIQASELSCRPGIIILLCVHSSVRHNLVLALCPLCGSDAE